jgi:hypothetical protein
MMKNILKKWYLIPITILILFWIFKTAVLLHIAPAVLQECDKKVWELNSKSYHLKITCNHIGGNNEAFLFKVESIPRGLLQEEWGSLTDLLYSKPVGMIFGNYDLDQDKELMVLGCEAGVSKTVIPGLTKNIQKYNYKDISYMGYYDFTGTGFQFKRIQDSPFFSIIKREYIDGALVIPEIWVFCFMVIVTGFLMLLNYLMSNFINYLRNKKWINTR